jgi:hypothetical protein
MGMGHAAYGAAGVGVGAGSSSVLEDHGGRLQNYSGRPAPYGGGGDDDLPRGHGTGGAAYGGFGGSDNMDRFGGTVLGMSNGGATPGGAFGVEDSSSTTRAHSSPLCPISTDVLPGDLSSGDCGNFTIGSGAGGGTPRGLMSSLACSPPSTLVGVLAMRAVLPARLRLRQRLVVLERMHRGIPKQLEDEIGLV